MWFFRKASFAAMKADDIKTVLSYQRDRMQSLFSFHCKDNYSKTETNYS